MKKPKIFSGIMIGVFFIVLAAVILGITVVRKDWDVSGMTKVECKITSYLKIVRTETIKGEYIDANGEIITADITLNRPGSTSMVGTYIEGYVGDNQNKVYCPPSLILRIIMYVLNAVFFFAGLFMIFLAIKQRADYNYLQNNDYESVQAEVIKLKKDKAQGKTWYDLDLLFADKYGNSRVANYRESKRYPHIGDKYEVNYAIKPNGKIVYMVIEK